MQLYQNTNKQDKIKNSDSAGNGLGHLKIDGPICKLRDKNARISILCKTPSHFKIALEFDIDENSFLETVSEGYRKFAERREKAMTKGEESAQNIDAICCLLERLLGTDCPHNGQEILI